MRVDLNPEKVIYENSPASEWNEAFPLGNGALGAMISGGLMEETFDLNQESIWSGGPRNRNNPDALSRLPEIRKLIREGRPDLAEQTALYAMAGTPESESVYQPLGRFTLNFDLNRPGRGLPGEAEPVPEDYLRKLDLEEAVVTVSFTRNGIQTLREHFVSAPAGCFVSRIICDSSGSLNFSGRFSRSGLTAFSGRSDGGADGESDRETALVLRSEGAGEGAVRFAAGARIVPVGGTMEFLGDHCIVRNAQEVLILVACRTSFFDKDYEQKMLEDLDRAAGRSWESLLKEHVEDYSALFGRTELSFSAAGEDCETLSTSRRLGALKEGCDDTALIPLYLNFGKYLMISSSRPGTLPSNLQGIWNPHDAPPWGSKYTININTQMNYWLAEPCGLGDCHRALFDHILRMIPNGRVTAESMYGCRGFTAHHNTDLWGDTAPQDHWMPATFWCLGGAWLCLHLIEHHDFTRDREFLLKFYPVLRECVLFFEDFLITAEDGKLVTSPSVSPENTYLLESGVAARICEGPAMDSQILHELISGYRDWSLELGEEEAVESSAALLAKLPPMGTGSDGRLLEWMEEYDEPEPGHRHISHLFALYPGHQIEPESDLAAAAEKSIRRRLENGGGHTGWSRAWIINFWARLGDGEEAGKNLRSLLTGSTLPNLFCDHPPFQIDGNFGGAAAIIEMLIQSSKGTIRILPALPSSWTQGQLTGAALRGGFTADLSWEKGALEKLRIRCASGGSCLTAGSEGKNLKILYREKMLEYNHLPGSEIVLDSGSFS